MDGRAVGELSVGDDSDELAGVMVTTGGAAGCDRDAPHRHLDRADDVHGDLIRVDAGGELLDGDELGSMGGHQCGGGYRKSRLPYEVKSSRPYCSDATRL